MFKRFRRLIRARARQQRMERAAERRREAIWAEQEFDWRRKREAEKDEVFRRLESAFTIARLSHAWADLSEWERIELKNSLIVNGFRIEKPFNAEDVLLPVWCAGSMTPEADK